MKRTLQTKALHVFCFVAILCCTANLLFSQTTWTGAVSTDWNNASNWTAGVPDANDNVGIPNEANDPTISVAGAVAKHINIISGAVLTIGASGTLAIEGSNALGNGMNNEGTVENSGTINLGTNISPGAVGISNSGTFNNSGGQINVDRANSSGIDNYGSFTNSGTINLGTLATNGYFGIRNLSTFNNSGGTINIEAAQNNSIYSADGTFSNSGTINIGVLGNGGVYGIFLDGTFNNSSGQVNIDNVALSGIYLQNTGSFNNQSNVTIGASTLVEGDPPPGVFNNDSGGNLTGSGNIESAIFANAGGTLSPGNSAGTMTFDADVNFSNSTLSIEINGTTTPGTDFDQVIVSGTATLGGTLNLVIGGGYTPANGDQVTILNATAISGNFSSITGASGWFPNYDIPSAGKVTLSFGSPLPIELIDFTGKDMGGQALLQWHTATETNNHGFEVERSGNGRDWAALGFVAGAGNSFEVNGYDFLDKTPRPGVNYYRLRQMDFDGQEEFSRVVSLELNNLDILSNLRVYPNPVSGGELTLFLPQNTNGEMVARLVNPAGQVLHHPILATGPNLLDISGLASGVYHLQINSEKGNVLKKILVQH